MQKIFIPGNNSDSGSLFLDAILSLVLLNIALLFIFASLNIGQMVLQKTQKMTEARLLQNRKINYETPLFIFKEE